MRVCGASVEMRNAVVKREAEQNAEKRIKPATANENADEKTNTQRKKGERLFLKAVPLYNIPIYSSVLNVKLGELHCIKFNTNANFCQRVIKVLFNFNKF